MCIYQIERNRKILMLHSFYKLSICTKFEGANVCVHCLMQLCKIYCHCCMQIHENDLRRFVPVLYAFIVFLAQTHCRSVFIFLNITITTSTTISKYHYRRQRYQLVQSRGNLASKVETYVLSFCKLIAHFNRNSTKVHNFFRSHRACREVTIARSSSHDNHLHGVIVVFAQTWLLLVFTGHVF